MKQLVLCIVLAYLPIACYGQQIGQSPSPIPSPAQRSTAQPFLRGELGEGALAPRTGMFQETGDLQQQLLSLESYLGSRRGLIEIPPNAPAGWWMGIANSSVRFIDDRGNSLPDAWGITSLNSGTGFKTGLANGILVRSTETEAASPDRYNGFVNMQFHYDAAQGGVNSYNSKIGRKTDYFNVLATSEMRTVGQKSGIASLMNSFSDGDTMGIQTGITQFGGYDTFGDEQTEGVRIQIQQGSASSLASGGIFEGTVKSISRQSLAYAASRDEYSLGEHRIIRDLDNSYGAGSIASIDNSNGSPNTVTITGRGTEWTKFGVGVHTHWNNLDAGGGVTDTNLAFCFDPLKSDGYDVCFPVGQILDNTHLTLNMIACGTGHNTHWPSSWPHSGSYRIFGAAWPTKADLADHTITAPDLSGLGVGHRIDQVLAYNMQTIGEWIVVSRHIGFPKQGGGLFISNWGTAPSPEMDYGVAVSGAFDTAFDFQPSNAPSGVPNYFARFYADPASKLLFDSIGVQRPAPEVALWRLRDAAGAAHVMLSFARDSATSCLLDRTLCVSPNGTVTAGRIGQQQADDYAGTITISGTDSGKADFKVPFQSNPVCTLTPTSDPSEVGTYWVSTSRTSVSAQIRNPGRITFNFICVGNPI